MMSPAPWDPRPAGKVEEMRKYQKHNWIIRDGKNPPAVLLCIIRYVLKYITPQQLLKDLTFSNEEGSKIFFNQHMKYFQEIYDTDPISNIAKGTTDPRVQSLNFSALGKINSLKKIDTSYNRLILFSQKIMEPLGKH